MGSHMAFAAKQSWLLSTLPPIWFDHGAGIFSHHGCEVGIWDHTWIILLIWWQWAL